MRVLSQGVLGAFHGHHGDLVAVEQHLRSQLEDLYPTALRMAVYHLGRREEPYLSLDYTGHTTTDATLLLCWFCERLM